jgi:hypothetical protein
MTPWTIAVSLGIAALAWSTDYGWRILRVPAAFRLATGAIFGAAILARLAGLNAIVTIPLTVLALSLFLWANVFARRVGASGRRYRVMLAYQRLVRLWDAREVSDPRPRATTILGSLEGERDSRTGPLIDALLTAWPDRLREWPVDESRRRADAERINAATERMNVEAARLFNESSRPFRSGEQLGGRGIR